MFYNAETWTLGIHQVNKLLATEMDFWRRISRKSRKEKILNLKIRETMNVQYNIIELFTDLPAFILRLRKAPARRP